MMLIKMTAVVMKVESVERERPVSSEVRLTKLIAPNIAKRINEPTATIHVLRSRAGEISFAEGFKKERMIVSPHSHDLE